METKQHLPIWVDLSELFWQLMSITFVGIVSIVEFLDDIKQKKNGK